MTSAEARFNKSLRPRKPEGSLGRIAQDVHLDSHTAPELLLFFGEFIPLPFIGRGVHLYGVIRLRDEGVHFRSCYSKSDLTAADLGDGQYTLSGEKRALKKVL